jgi:ubiquinol-cytochrome c reductase cytochrome c subunit
MSRRLSQLAVPVAVAAAVTGLVVLSSGALSAGPGPVVAQVPTEDLTDEEVAGRTLYLRDCAWCHGSEGEGSVYGPGLRRSGAASTDFMLRTGRMPIEEPRENPPPSTPAYSAEEIDSLVAYAATLGEGPPVPGVLPSEGDLDRGAILYQENCAACHSSTGVGAALTQGEMAPSLRDLSSTVIAEAVRIGGAGLLTGDMPIFDEAILPAEDLNSLVRYVVEVLQHPPDRGGAGLNHLGPVAEGFVAVFVALPLMVLVIRWIGTRAAK